MDDIDLDAATAYDTAPSDATAPPGEVPPATPAPDSVDEPRKADQEIPAEAPAPVPAEAEADDRVLVLGRQNRDLVAKEKATAERASVSEGRLKQAEPVFQLLALAKDDPRAFLAEVADIVGLTPERALELMSTAGAGGDVELTDGDKISRLERQLAELRNPPAPEAAKPPADQPSAEAQTARLRELDVAQATLEATAAQNPLCTEEPHAPEAAFLLRVRHWEANGRLRDGSTRPGYQPISYSQALAQVEATLRADVERRAERIGMSKPAQPGTEPPPTFTSSGGLSNRNRGPVVLVDIDRARPDDEIREDMKRQLGW